MNLIRHQFCKDCFHLRVPVTLWLLLVLVRAALITPGIAEPGNDLFLQMMFRILTTLVPLLQTILLLVLVPLLLHEEPLVGTTAFWFTRPIDGGALFKSKMLFVVGLLIVPPLLTEVVVLAVHGAAALQVALAVPEILLEDGKFLVYVVVLAALTQTFARYALLGASFVIGFYLLFIVGAALAWYFDFPEFLKPAGGVNRADSAYVVSVLFFITIAVVILIDQYRTRDSQRAWIRVGVAFLVYLALGYYWPREFLHHHQPRREAGIDTSKVGVAILTDPRFRRVSDTFRSRSTDEAKKSISGQLEISGLPAGYVAEPSKIMALLKFPDGKIVTHEGYEYSRYERNWNRNVIEQSLVTSKILNADKPKGTQVTLLSVNDDLFGKYAAVAGVISAEVEFVVKRYEVTANLPLQPKARYDHGSKHAVITQVLKQTGGATVLLRESEVSLFFAGDRHHDEMSVNLFGRAVIYILRNPEKAEALWPVQEPGPGFEFLDLFQKRLRTTPLALRYSALTSNGQKLTELDDSWLAKAELVRIEEKEVGRFSKTIRLDGFLMGAQ
jgi:hypothetical protein